MKLRKIMTVFLLAGMLSLTGCEKKPAVEPEQTEEAVEQKDDKEEKEEVSEEVKEDEESSNDQKEILEFLLGTWGNETAFSDDETEKFSMAYYTEFKEDGTVEQYGYRNKDKGTYKIEDQNTVIATFDQNYFEDPADPDDQELMEDYVYTVTYYIDREAGTLDAKYSEEFHDEVVSNAVDGILRKQE